VSTLGDERGDDITDDEELLRGGGYVRRLFDDSEPRAGGTVDGVRLGLGIVGVLVVLVTLGFPDREGEVEGKTANESFKIGGILAGGIDPNPEQDLVLMLVSELFECIVEALVTGPGLREPEAAECGTTVRVQE
jgi:hypothetical protein